MKKFNIISYYLTILIIIVISFLLYSSNFYPLLCSDDALNVLMAHYYKLPGDFYCWGQDRGGTLIPLISQVFIKIFHFSALTSVSLSNYLVLIIGFIGFSSLFKSTYGKLIFAIIWFLPFERFTFLLRYPIGVEYSLIAFAIFLINRLLFNSKFNNIKNNLLLIAITFILIISIWVSDLAIVTIVILFLILLIYNIIEQKKFVTHLSILLYFFIGIISCFLFIKYAKTFAVIKTDHYLSINNWTEIKQSIQLIKTAFVNVMTFSENEIFVSIYTYCVFVFCIIFSIYLISKKLFIKMFTNKWLTFFAADFIAVFLTFLISTWVLRNGMGRWYFVASYISFSVTIILIIENVEVHKFFRYFIVVIVIIGAISPVYNMKFVSPKRLRPMVDVVGEFRQLGKIGIIAEFWDAYIASCPDPEMIKATPNDQGTARNQKLIDDVFERENIYVIKGSWLGSFPDTLRQYGRSLLKDGHQFRLGDCDICKYKKL